MFNKAIIIIIVLVIVVLWFVYPTEHFLDITGQEFVAVGAPGYDMRGARVDYYPSALNYIRPDRNVVLTDTNTIRWESNNSPVVEGIPNCHRVGCPMYTGGFDKLDKCWYCAPNKVPPMKPYIDLYQ